MLKRSVAFGLAAASALLIFAACGGGGSSPGASQAAAPAEPKTLNVAISENAVSLDPHYSSMIGLNTVRDQIWETLVGYVEDANGSVSFVPKLATAYSASADGKVWTFTLRQGVKFHNGEDFTSDDCAVTFQRLIDNSATLNIGAIYWTNVEKFETPDDYTFVLYMKNPTATMEIALTQTAIFAGDAFKQDPTAYITRQLYGTSPWKFEEWVDGQYARFTKFQDYWGDFESYYDELYLRFITEESTAIASMLAGDIKVYSRSGGITNTSLPQFSGRNDIAMKEILTSSYQYFGLQTRAGHIFNNIKAREAFSLAIDRQAIADSILPSVVPNNRTWFVQGVFGHDETQPALEFNPERARQLLAEAGYKGEPIVLSSNTGTTMSSEILLAVSDMLNEVGFNSSTQIVESATLLDMRLSGNYDVFFVNVMPGYNDVGEVLTQRVMQDYHSSNYTNARANALIDEANREFDREKRRQLLLQVNRLLAEDWAPFIMLTQIRQTNPYYKGVTGFAMTSFGQFGFANVTYDPSLVN